MMALQTPNLVEDIEDLIEHFDTSNYPGNLKKKKNCAAGALANFFLFFQRIIPCTAKTELTISSW